MTAIERSRRQEKRAADHRVVVGAGLGGLIVPLPRAFIAVVEARVQDDFPSEALVWMPLLGLVIGGVFFVPALRWARARLPGLPDGFTIFGAGATALLVIVGVTTLVTALRGGDGLSAFFLGGAALLPLALAVTVGVLIFRPASRPRSLLVGWLAIFLGVSSGLVSLMVWN